jgi:hypothetical protein
MLTVVEVVSFKDNAVTYLFSDGTTATHQTLKDSRGFMKAGPLDTLNSKQLLAVSKFNEQANKPNGGWL